MACGDIETHAHVKARGRNNERADPCVGPPPLSRGGRLAALEVELNSEAEEGEA